MQVLDYFSEPQSEKWLAQIAQCDWGAGIYLHELLVNGELLRLCGSTTRVLLLADNDVLAGFCTLAEQDDIQPTSLTPWVGFLYIYPPYRGHRHAGRLLTAAEAQALVQGASSLYISTNHVGLYEKYGYHFLSHLPDISGEPSRIYEKRLR